MDPLRELYRTLVPELTRTRVREYAKTAVALAGFALQAVNLLVPDYSDEATVIVGLIIAAATWLGVRATPNKV